MRIVSWVLVVALLSGVLVVAGCETQAQTGALAGGALGAAAGQAFGRNTSGTLIGAGVGAAGGYMLGNEADKSRMQQDIRAQGQAANTYVVNVHNSNGSISPVTLQRAGNVWIGPRGEQYTAIPDESQLRQAGYGL